MFALVGHLEADPGRPLAFAIASVYGGPTMRDRKVLRAPLAVAGAVFATETATHLVDFKLLDFRSRILDSQYVWSYSHLAATAMFGAGALACGLGAAARREARLPWLTTSALFAFLCVDGATRLHDGFSLWPVAYAPLLGALAAGILVISAGSRLAPVARAGLIVLGASLAVHVLGHAAVQAVGWGPDRWGYQIKVATKEGLELAGWTLLVPTLARLALERRQAQRRRDAADLPDAARA
jgi:hypothetical protein